MCCAFGRGNSPCSRIVAIGILLTHYGGCRREGANRADRTRRFFRIGFGKIDASHPVLAQRRLQQPSQPDFRWWSGTFGSKCDDVFTHCYQFRRFGTRWNACFCIAPLSHLARARPRMRAKEKNAFHHVPKLHYGLPNMGSLTIRERIASSAKGLSPMPT